MAERSNLASLVAQAAAAAPNAPALITHAESISWQAFAQRLARKAAGLVDLGLRPGDRVAVHGGMTLFTVEALGALAWAGLVAVPLNTRLSAAEQRDVCERAEIMALLHESRDIPDGLAGVTARTMSASALDAGAAPVPAVAVAPEALAALIFTGGTTGQPKGVMLSGADLIRHGTAVRDWLDYGPDDRVLQSQPLFHVAGINQLYAVVMARAALVFPVEPGVDGILTAIGNGSVNAIGLVPTTLSMLLDRLDGDSAARQLRNIVYGAAPITPDLMARARAALPHTRFCQFYGQTETGPVTALLPQDHLADDPVRLRSCGRARAGLDIGIFTPSGEACPVGTVGETRFRGAGLTRGYWRDEERTRDLFSGGWLCSGDLGFVDAQGYLTIVDRLKDMIVTGGENVFGAEVEGVLAMHDGVQDVAVLGLPDPLWGEAVHAIIVPAKGAAPLPADLVAHCRPHLAGYKIPRHFHFRDAPLPLSAVGKVLKSDLKAELAAESARKD